MTDIPWKLIGYGAAALIIGLILWRVHAWREGYLERDQAVSDLAAYQDSVAEREKQEAEDRKSADARILALSVRLETAQGTIEGLRKQLIQSLVHSEKPAKDGKCDDPRIGPDYISVYNATADAATRAVSAAH